jgi:hypothetical protein
VDTTKPWFASQTIWASLLQMAVGVAVGLGLINTGLGAWSLYGRVTASKTLTGV